MSCYRIGFSFIQPLKNWWETTLCGRKVLQTSDVSSKWWMCSTMTCGHFLMWERSVFWWTRMVLFSRKEPYWSQKAVEPLERSAFYKEHECYYFVRKTWSRREERNLLLSLSVKKKQWRINVKISNIVDNEAI